MKRDGSCQAEIRAIFFFIAAKASMQWWSLEHPGAKFLPPLKLFAQLNILALQSMSVK